MRYTILGTVMGLLFILFLSASMTISGRSVRQNELDQAVNRGVEQTVERIKAEGYQPVSEAELVAELSGNILGSINSDSGIAVRVMECDMEKGILSIAVQADFKHPNGRAGTVSSEGTVLWEQYEIQE